MRKECTTKSRDQTSALVESGVNAPAPRSMQHSPRAVHQQMHGLCLAPSTSAARLWPGQLQRGGPAAQGRVVRHGKIEPEQADDGADQALGLALRQPEYSPQGQGCPPRVVWGSA